MLENPKVSVIVPVYKAEAYLYRCVDSLLVQTFTNFEILLIDDGSPDRSGEICDEYARKDTRVRVFHKENGGVSSARQCGLDNAVGEYTIHADPDDWVEPDMLEELYIKAIESDADMLICDFFINAGNKQIYCNQEPTILNHERVMCELFQHLHGSCGNKLIKRACYNMYDVRFPEKISFCEDLYTNVSLLKNDIKIAYLSKAFYHYVQNINSNSIVKTYNIQDFEYCEMLLNKFSKLTCETSSFGLCVSKMSFLIVYRAFRANIFTSVEFKNKCGKYRKQMSEYKYQNRVIKCALDLSCLGYYKVVYLFFTIIQKMYGVFKAVNNMK
ncbi:glycosyltransferase family 2 protein [Parabacteroides sp. BX2]|jgi:glycosyltransferase involved in cell wall biosynthesis|uniref:Glycosyltransferase family 2 protein n=1 Tax=Parabacteroides segnis TaxID=2763058 RepID=A0ABR7E9P7_9BACT|nr:MULTISPECIES: glycosyltransferase family 2 protein [Parabacteroides]MBC5646518.1 glycosyltransferase family 2 protein [Parabacteroides segnis]MCM0716141.1 glycosyltransferase [Parabacteroides sp. TA-V-105]